MTDSSELQVLIERLKEVKESKRRVSDRENELSELVARAMGEGATTGDIVDDFVYRYLGGDERSRLILGDFYRKLRKNQGELIAVDNKSVLGIGRIETPYLEVDENPTLVLCTMGTRARIQTRNLSRKRQCYGVEDLAGDLRVHADDIIRDGETASLSRIYIGEKEIRQLFKDEKIILQNASHMGSLTPSKFYDHVVKTYFPGETKFIK